MSFRQNVLSFVHRKGKYVKVDGKGLIKSGGTVKNHNRPYQLNDMAPKNKTSKSYTPIHFKL